VTVATAFFEHVIRLHGIPASIVSDRDPVFTSRVWQELFRLSGTQLCLSSTFHPQTDGQSKVTNRVITMYLRCLASDRPRSWLRWLPWAEYCYNTSFQTTLKATPFQVVYGHAPPPLLPFSEGTTKVAAVDKQMRDRDVFLAEVKDQLLQAQALIKTAHDKVHHQVEFTVGDWVWLRLNQRMASTVRDATKSMLSPKFFMPYAIIERIGPVAYRLQIPPKSRIHDVFHVAFLKKFEGTPPMAAPPLPNIVRGRAMPQPAAVVRARQSQDSWDVLVKSRGVIN
jgi:hypothetical protein